MIGCQNVYRHYKGGLYEFVCWGTVEATGEEIAVYLSLETGDVYTRPKDEWLGFTEEAGVGIVKRFQPVWGRQ